MSTKIREYMVFTGRVQGVGFRYKMTYLANSFGLTGWVRNEYDGSVSAELQGLPGELDQIIQRLGQDRYIEIDGISRKKIPVRDDEREFRIR
ncbi:MAG: acylphosphatase [Agathobacter sp.]|nr:acylphosphatase [Agathobacter sp.]